MAAGLEGFPGAYPLGFTPRRSVVDPVTGRPVISSTPTGAVQQRASLLPVGRDDSGGLVPAVPQGVFDAIDAARFPGQVLRGEKGVFDPATGHTSDEALGAATGLAGLAMTGSMPFGAPKGALRSFGGAAAKDDPFAALEAGLSGFTPEAPLPGPRRLDPNAKSWDVYHGSGSGPDFQRFDPSVASNPAERGGVFFAPDPETASAYAAGQGAPGEAGSRVFRATVEPGRTKVFDLGLLAETDPSFNALAREITTRDSGPQHGATFDRYMDGFRGNRAEHRELSAQAEAMGYPASPPDGISWGHGHIGAALKRARDEGLDTAIIRGTVEHGGDDQIVALTPGRVRSFYSPDHVLYSGGRSAAPAGAAALAVPDAAPTSTQEQPMTAGLGNLSPEDFAAIFGAAPPGGAPAARRIPSGLGVPQSAGADGAERPVAAMPSFGLGSQMPDAPQMPPALAPAAPQRQEPPAPRMMAEAPLPPPRPAEFGTPSADMPAPNAVPTSGKLPDPAGAPKAEEPSFLDRIMGGIQKTDGLLGSIGIGMLTTPGGIGAGLGAGLKNYQQAGVQKAATNLAQAEFQLKQRKLQQETGALTGNAGIIKKAYPSLSDTEAAALADNGPAVTEAVKILRDPNHGRDTDPAVIRARAQAQAEGAAAGKPDETYSPLSEADRVARGYPAGSYQVDSKGKVSPVNPTGTTINMGAEKAQDAKVGGSYGEYQVDLATKGRNAASTLNTLAIMEQAARNPAFYSGAGAEWVKRGNQALVALGVKDANYTKPTEVFDALSNKVVLDGLGGSLGPGISNTDRDYIGRTAPTLERTQAGNVELIGIARTLAQRQQAVAKLARDYAAKNGGRVDAGFDQVLEDYAGSNPLFPAAQASATAQPDAKTGAGAARSPARRAFDPATGGFR